MTNIKTLTAIALTSAMILSSCAQQNPDGTRTSGISKSTGGTLLGGAAGGILGSNIGKGKGKTAATIGGALLGGLAGNSVGSSLENADNNAAYGHSNAYPVNGGNTGNGMFQDALENSHTGETTSFQNNDGSITRMTVTNTYTRGGQNCRNYTQTSSYGGSTSGTACRGNNGYWN